jgi:hypothetical protein
MCPDVQGRDMARAFDRPAYAGTSERVSRADNVHTVDSDEWRSANEMLEQLLTLEVEYLEVVLADLDDALSSHDPNRVIPQVRLARSRVSGLINTLLKAKRNIS